MNQPRSIPLAEALAQGLKLHQAGEFDRAEQVYKDVLQASPQQPDAWNLLAGIAQHRGQHALAVEYLQKAIEFRPAQTSFLGNLGTAYASLGQLEAAAASYRRALEIEPRDAGLLYGLGQVLARQEKSAEAVEVFRQAIAARPEFAAAHNHLGITLRSLGEIAQAVESFRRFTQLEPQSAAAFINLGNALRDQGQLDTAIAAYDQALRLASDHPRAHLNRALALLLKGDYAEGWDEYEWRWQVPGIARRPSPPPEWDGSNPAGRTLLLYAEQGLGDTLHFVRYAALVQRLGAKVVVECPPPLARLLASCPGIDVIVPRGQALPPCDAQVALLSLPRILGTTLDNVPQEVPYLFADPKLLKSWRQELDRLAAGKLKIGINWQGSAHGDPFWRLPLDRFAALARMEGVQLFSLHKGPASEQLAGLPANAPIIDLGSRLDETAGPFMDTAAVMSQLDLMITADTSTGHLAGALGVPTWICLCATPEFRWLLNRGDSPWYPTVKLLRQSQLGDWDDVFAQMKEGLRQLVGEKVGAVSSPKVIQWTPDAVSISQATLSVKETQNAATGIAEQPETREVELSPGHALRADSERAVGELRTSAPQTESPSDLLAKGLKLHQAGKLEEAAALYRRLLEIAPQHADAWNLLGATAHQQGRHAEAIEFLEKAIQLLPGQASFHGNLAAVYAASARIDKARNSFQSAVECSPLDPSAHANLGHVLRDMGKWPEAADCYRQVVQLRPQDADAHSFLAAALRQLGRTADALAHSQHAARLQPGSALHHNNLANAWRESGDRTRALASYEQAVRCDPNYAVAHMNRGNLLREQGDSEQALECYQRALQINPDFVEAHINFAIALRDVGRFEEAEATLRQALRLKPNHAETHNVYSSLLEKAGRLGEAEAELREALRLDPNFYEGHCNLGHVLQQQEKLAEAETVLLKGVQIRPESAAAYCHLGNVYRKQHQTAKAVAAFEQAVGNEPDSPLAQFNMGVAMFALGRYDRAIGHYRRTLELQPKYTEAHSNLLFALNYDPLVDDETLFQEHRRFGEEHDRPALQVTHPNSRDPNRRLRVGYVSPDLRRHPVAYFIEPALQHRDSAAIENILYAEVSKPDETSARLRGMANEWRDTCRMTDDEVAELVRKDGIDILVDLAGHTAHHRLGAFTLRPAPVQVTYLGYPNTTGLASVDYRLADDVTDPSDEPRRYTEQLARLAGGYCCYTPPASSPEVNDLPAAKSGRITFGSLHTLLKLNSQVIDLWCRVLKAIPDSRLLLCRDPLQGATRESFLREFTRRGIAAERIEIRHEGSAPGEFLSVYHDIDLSLDTFPWSGHTTACESLWMGVPILTMRGSRHAARLVASVVTYAGYPQWITANQEEYVDLAVRTAGDIPGLAQVRANLRATMLSSRLCDGVGFTRSLEETYRGLWRKWCGE
jgi:protein O-GlcNAc transferase